MNARWVKTNSPGKTDHLKLGQELPDGREGFA